MKVTAQYAEEHIAHLFAIAGAGEEVEIALPTGPLLKLVAAPAAAASRPDPFDRMLITQARALPLTLVTKDSKIAFYEVDSF